MTCDECIHLEAVEGVIVCTLTGDVLHYNSDCMPLQTAECMREQLKTDVELSVGDTTPNFGHRPDDERV